MDWINDKVYFSFGDPTPNNLVIYDITTGMHYDITPAPASSFLDLALDPFGGYILSENYHQTLYFCYFNPGICTGPQEVTYIAPH